MSDTPDRARRKRKSTNNVLSLYLIQCLDGTRPASQMPAMEDSDEIMPHFGKIKKTDEGIAKSKLNIGGLGQSNIVRSQGTYVYDRKGLAYLDSVSGVSHVGHCHPRINQIAQVQLSRYGTGVPLYLNPDKFENSPRNKSTFRSRYSERLLSTLPENLDSVLFFSSGSEANDVAIQMARSYTGHHDVVIFEEGFHGSLGIVSDVSHKILSRGGNPKKPWVHILPIPDTYRGPYLEDDPEAYEKYFEDAKNILDLQVEAGRKIACLITEPVFTFHSVLIPPAAYFQKICNYIRKLGGLVIIDEVQTGLGRLGDFNWAYEMHDIVPDILTTGKPLGNGHPLAVTITSNQISSSLGVLRMMYEPTMAQEAIGNAVLDVMGCEELQLNACKVGRTLIGLLNRLMSDHPLIGAVRGMGLLIGVEFIWDHETKSPAKEVAQVVLYQMREHQIITAVEGKYQNIIFLIPPMCFSKNDAKTFSNTLGLILDELRDIGKESICEKLLQLSDKYSSWNNIPEDFLNSCHSSRNDLSTYNQTNTRFHSESVVEEIESTSGDEDCASDDSELNSDEGSQNGYDNVD